MSAAEPHLMHDLPVSLPFLRPLPTALIALLPPPPQDWLVVDTVLVERKRLERELDARRDERLGEAEGVEAVVWLGGRRAWVERVGRGGRARVDGRVGGEEGTERGVRATSENGRSTACSDLGAGADQLRFTRQLEEERSAYRVENADTLNQEAIPVFPLLGAQVLERLQQPLDLVDCLEVILVVLARVCVKRLEYRREQVQILPRRENADDVLQSKPSAGNLQKREQDARSGTRGDERCRRHVNSQRGRSASRSVSVARGGRALENGVPRLPLPNSSR